MKTLLKVLLAIVVMALLFHATIYSAKRTEIKECMNWQAQAETYPGFYLLDWQKQQCEHYNIEVLPKLPPQASKIEPTEGLATWYDYDLRTSDQRCLEQNEPCYSQMATTCASRDYPRGSVLKVSYPQPLDPDGLFHPYFYKAITCLVNDYGPQTCEDRIAGGIDTKENCVERIIDLSSYAFKKLADPSLGIINVAVEFLE